MKLSEQDRKQQELLKEFDKELFTYTGQIAWFLPGMISFIVLILGAIPVSENSRFSILYMIYLVAFLVIYILFPYEYCNEFLKRQKKTDIIYNKLKYIPISRKNFICVRMEYLFKYLWKLCLIELVIHVIISIASRSFHVVDYIYVVVFMFVLPMAFGWFKLTIGYIKIFRG
jgi:hypothetical protein